MIWPSRQLKQKSVLLAPSKAFKHALWRRLDAQWDSRALPAFAWYEQVWFRFGMAVCGSIVVVTSFGTGVYAYTSPDVTTGTVLYPIKQKLEAVEEKLQTTPVAKAKFYLKTLQRREAEKKVLQKKNASIEKIDEQINTVVNELKNTDSILTTTTSTEAENVHSAIERRLDRRQKILKQKENRLENKKSSLEDARDTIASSTVRGTKIFSDAVDGATSSQAFSSSTRRDQNKEWRQRQNNRDATYIPSDRFRNREKSSKSED